IAVVGHGIWVLVAMLFGGGARRESLNLIDRELANLETTRLQMRALVARGELDESAFETVPRALGARRRTLLYGELAPRAHPAAEQRVRSPEPPVPPREEAILEVLPVPEPSPQPEPATPPVRALPVEVARPRRSLGEVLAGFMEERNILWGEVV